MADKSAFARSYKRYTHRDDAWNDGEVIVFRTDLSDVDDDIASELVQESILSQVDQDELNAAQKAGEDINAWLRARVDRRLFITGKRAFIFSKIVRWTLRIPEDFQDDTQEAIGVDEDGEDIFPTHELAGQIAPVDPLWMGLLGPEVVDRIHERLITKMVGRSAEEQKLFRVVDPGVDESTGDGEGSTEVPETD